MLKKIFGFFILLLYSLVIATAAKHGALISVSSLTLGLVGLLTLIFFLSAVAQKISLVDIPDDFRKSHSGRIPLIGGAAIYISIIYGTYILGLDPFYRVLIFSLIPILIIGVIDDLKGMPVSIRIIAQIISSWIVILATDIYLRDLGDLLGSGNIVLGNFGIPFTIFAAVGMCNAFNMLDGKDGLAGSVSMIVILGLFFLMTYQGNSYNYAIVLLLSLFIFLLFNLDIFGKERKIFLGDHGALGLGHIIAWNLIYLSQETGDLSPASALWFVVYPLTDALLTFLRRFRAGSQVFDADRQHFHHKLSDMGFSNNKILLVAVVISVLGAFYAVLQNIFGLSEYISFYLYVSIVVSIMVITTHKHN